MLSYATQITSPQPEGSNWKPGIHRFRTKREANVMTNGINNTGGKAQTIRKRGSCGWNVINDK